MSQTQPECVQCGGRDYMLEDGFYFCRECQLQSQDIRETVFEGYFKGQKGTKIVVESKTKTKSLPEIYEFEVMKGLVDELILLGAPKTLKLVVMQLWFSYLKKIEIAFISQTTVVKPRVGTDATPRDLALIFGASKDDCRSHREFMVNDSRRKRSGYPKSVTSVSTNASILSIKRARTRSKNVLAKAEYSRAVSEATSYQDKSLEELTSNSETSSHKSIKIKYSKYAKGELNKVINKLETEPDLDRKKVQRELFRRSNFNSISMTKIVYILRLALIVLDEDIQLSDLQRWSREGYLSFENLEKLIPTSVDLKSNLKFSQYSSNFLTSNLSHSNFCAFANFLQVELQTNIYAPVKRYILELDLPSELEIFIGRLLKNLNLPADKAKGIDCIAMSIIIIFLKYLFGLDDVTEYNLSKIATDINNHPDLQDYGEQFNFYNWTRHITKRGAIIAKIHHNTRNKLYRESNYGGPEPFLSNWDINGVKHNQPRLNIIVKPSDIKHHLNKVLNDLVLPLKEPTKPSLTPLSTMYNQLKPGSQMRNQSLKFLTKKKFRKKIKKVLQIKSSTELHSTFVNLGGILEAINAKQESERSNPMPKRVKIIKDNLKNNHNDCGCDKFLKKFTTETIFKLYKPGGDYWRTYESSHTKEYMPYLSTSFTFLLNECARIINHSPEELYQEFGRIQAYISRFVKTKCNK